MHWSTVMNFVNGNVETFVGLFGPHGYNYISRIQDIYPDNKINVIFAKTGDFPELDNVPAQAFVSHIKLDTLKISYDKTDPLAVVFYPEIMNAQNIACEGMSTEFQNIGTLIHEMTHVRQVLEGRMETVGFMKMIWEGVYHEIELKGYLAQPWEKEACMAQLEWLSKGRTELAEAWYEVMVESSNQIE